MSAALKAPFPWFGGKRDAAALVWARFGDVPNYVEPFFGSGAVLLGRPTDARTETVNDLDGLLCNFWRAAAQAPEAVAAAADWPVSECDLSARHLELVELARGGALVRGRGCGRPKGSGNSLTSGTKAEASTGNSLTSGTKGPA